MKQAEISISTTGRYVDLDVIKMFIAMNRDALDMKIPMLPEFAIHFIAQRRQILNNFKLQAIGMSMFMQCLAPQVQGDAEFLLAQETLREYKDWITNELVKLDELGNSEENS